MKESQNHEKFGFSHRRGTTYVRMCGQVYNTPDDYDRLADALLAELG